MPSDGTDRVNESPATVLDDTKNAKVESVVDVDEKAIPLGSPEAFPPYEWLERLKAEYTGQHAGETLPPGCDPDRMAKAVLTLSEPEALAMLEKLLETQKNDYTVDQKMLARFRELLHGAEVCRLEHEDWSYEVCKRAGLAYNWSLYAEVRAVTLPYDDPEETCESLRAYFLGMFWVCVCTFVNTFFSPRQPGITIPGSVVQLLLVPMGRALAWILPDWSFTFRGTRFRLNPGPWTSKEQLFSTIIFTGASSIGNFTGLLVLRMPVFFGQGWATFGFNIMLALANQVYGLGMAGILRRLSVYPVEAVWPARLPTLALNRALIHADNKREKVHGWSLSRYRMFVYCAIFFLIYYWIPNQFFVGLRLFNWMTWIDPKNFNLAAVTGSYGGMGFNPLSSWDPNVSGIEAMNSPFFAQLQQYVMRVMSGIIILIMYYKNAFWGAFMPPNSNAVFDNKGVPYNITQVLGDDQRIDMDKYMEYGPPYYAIANLFVTGANFAYYTFSLVYVFTKYWGPIKKAFVGIAVNAWKRQSVYTGFDDGHARIMKRNYKETPEWWYGIVFAFGFLVSVVSLTAWPTQTPWYSIFGITGIGALLTIPWVVIESIASTGIQLNVIWQVLPGLWFPGNQIALLVISMLGGAFEQMAGGFSADLKYAHYASLPPRAVFRGHVSAVVVNCFMYCAVLELLMVYANNDNSLCQWNNKQFMVCQYAHSVYSSTVQFGLFGTNNSFKLYPILAWCFLIGAILGVVWILGEKLLPRLRLYLKGSVESTTSNGVDESADAQPFDKFDRLFWRPAASVMATLNPAIALSGALSWAGNQNLTYATLGIYIAWIFQYYLKRRYTSWWQKYAYLIFAGLSVGVAVAGLIVTLVFSFGAGQGVSFSWYMNEAPMAGVDYELYNNAASLYTIPEEGFGLRPDQYPTEW